MVQIKKKILKKKKKKKDHDSAVNFPRIQSNKSVATVIANTNFYQKQAMHGQLLRPN